MNGVSTSAYQPARLVALATAVPEFEIDQIVAADRARDCFGSRMRDYDRLARVFVSTGIERRFSVRPLEWLIEPHGWHERTEAYLEGACALYERVVEQALASAGIDPSEIDAVVSVSSTGIATPSLGARVLPRMGFRPQTYRIPVFGLGCAGGVSGLALGARLATTHPKTTVLMVTVELCTLAFRLDRATKADVIAASLFGDGAAAAILSNDERYRPIANVVGATEHQWPKTLDIMGWQTDDVGFGVVLSRSLPTFIARNYRATFEAACQRMGLADAGAGRVVCHPGGTRVLDAIESALGVATGALDHERTIMRDFGNMSAPTVIFVLERVIQAALPKRATLAALGPGFTASFLALDAVAG
ncbi:MAG: type III polyketide synthase [Vulcanimicrobiaceae bacterium]